MTQPTLSADKYFAVNTLTESILAGLLLRDGAEMKFRSFPTTEVNDGGYRHFETAIGLKMPDGHVYTITISQES